MVVLKVECTSKYNAYGGTNRTPSTHFFPGGAFGDEVNDPCIVGRRKGLLDFKGCQLPFFADVERDDNDAPDGTVGANSLFTGSQVVEIGLFPYHRFRLYP